MYIYFICIICIITAILGIIRISLYKRQIASICRQIKYIIENESNVPVTREVSSKEINELVDTLNNMIKGGKNEKIEMEKKDIRLKEAITNISHDIRTPLTSLNGYFELLEETEDKEEREHYVVVIRERIACLKDMLEQLFTYVKLQNGDYVFDLQEFDINKELCDTLVEFYEEFKKKNMEPQILLQEEPVNVCLNKMAVHRIFENIIKNSIEHGENYFKCSMTIYRDKVCIIVKNDVKNPEDIDIEKIFERFYKADKSRSQTSTGLGLAIARDMVLRMGGSIQADMQEEIFKIEVIFPI